MDITYTAVRNPRWVHPTERTFILSEVNFDHITEEEWSPCVTVASGDLPHIHEIHARCIAGDFGPIGDYVAPDNIPTTADGEPVAVNWFIREKRNELLAECDHVMLSDNYNSLTTAKQQEWTTYRQALRDMPGNSAYANLEGVWNASTNDYDPSVTITWPTKPS